MTVKLRVGTWYLWFNRYGRAKPVNAEGNYRIRSRKFYATRLRPAE